MRSSFSNTEVHLHEFQGCSLLGKTLPDVGSWDSVTCWSFWKVGIPSVSVVEHEVILWHYWTKQAPLPLVCRTPQRRLGSTSLHTPHAVIRCVWKRLCYLYVHISVQLMEGCGSLDIINRIYLNRKYKAADQEKQILLFWKQCNS